MTTLREYREKRDFEVTAEPPPEVSKGRVGNAFVVQKHDASRLHYDFRLEMDGVLKSWAVPKGFPFAKAERHLAMHVEDHPLDYAHFEGIIPKGQYGGGTVMVWDTGTYEVIGENPMAALAKGKIHLRLNGKKLRGEWTLVRTRGDGDRDAWLMIKSEKSIRAVSKKKDDQSVITGRTMRQIAEQRTATWESHSTPQRGSSGPAKSGVRRVERKSSDSRPERSSKPRGSRKVKWVEPMKATLVNVPPERGDWLYELKWDGIRALAIKDGPVVELISRNNKPLTAEFPEIRDAVSRLPMERGIIDGEVCALNADGRPSFQLLQARKMGTARPPIFFYAFDLLNIDGENLMPAALQDRKARLEQLLADADPAVRYSGSLEGDVHQVLKEISSHGMEGVIGKRRDSIYEPGVRSKAWVKVKCGFEQEFVIGGFTAPQGAREHFGAILVGYYEGEKFRFAGKVGTGFDREWLERLYGCFSKRIIKACPFADLPRKSGGKWVQTMSPAKVRHCTWVRPDLVCQVRFAEWTNDGSLRQPVFLGLRDDKDASEVVRETAS